MLIVKLGGSLFQSAELLPCLQTLVRLSATQRIVIVPGGGPFADQVRSAQHYYKFNDSLAHHMAILSMAQFGLTLLGLEPKSKPYYLGNHIEDLTQLGIWLPDKALLSEPDLNHSWDITSDSLALWLAQHLDASRLFLIKRQRPKQGSINELSEKGIIDAGFPNLYIKKTVPTYVIDAKQINDFDLNAIDGLLTL